MPGVQKPHWKAPASREGALQRAHARLSVQAFERARPSALVAVRAPGVRQARIGTPSTCTVQAPQTPWLQPRLAAVSCSRSRSTVSSVSCRPARDLRGLRR